MNTNASVSGYAHLKQNGDDCMYVEGKARSKEGKKGMQTYMTHNQFLLRITLPAISRMLFSTPVTFCSRLWSRLQPCSSSIVPCV